MTDAEFHGFLNSVGHMVRPQEFRLSVYQGGVEQSLRKVVWRHLLNVYPLERTGQQRFDYLKKKSCEYYRLRDEWRTLHLRNKETEEIKFVSNMVKKDVLRTDRKHPFYEGSDTNKNVSSLFNLLTTYALAHPEVSYCQGMSDLASPILYVQNDEAHAYICFCGLMTRLRSNFAHDGDAMTLMFQHLALLLQHHDPDFFGYLKSNRADDMFFCYRWLLLELKREFPFDDTLLMLEVMWSSLPPRPPHSELALADPDYYSNAFGRIPVSPNIRNIKAYLSLKSRRQHSREQDDVASVPGHLELVTNHQQGPSKVVESETDCPRINTTTTTATIDLVPQFRSIDIQDSSKASGKSKASATSQPAYQTPFKSEPSHSNCQGDGPVKAKSSRASMLNCDDVKSSQQPPSADGVAMMPELVENYYGDAIELKTMSGNGVRATPGVSGDAIKASPGVSGDADRTTPGVSGDAIKASPGVTGDADRTTPGVSGDARAKRSVSPRVSDTALVISESDVTEKTMNVGMGSDDVSSDASLSSNPAISFVNVDEKLEPLPPPETFGNGNPFLMFLCLSLFSQHRDHIIKNRMDYNDMAMLFDKMVRKHDVTKVLYQAQSMYASYLKQQQQLLDDEQLCHNADDVAV